MKTEFTSHADDIHLTLRTLNTDHVIKTLENDFIELLKCFSDNLLKANRGKCHFLISNKGRE